MLTFVGSTFSYKKGFVFVIIVLTLEINDYFGAKSIHIGAYIILFWTHIARNWILTPRTCLLSLNFYNKQSWNYFPYSLKLP